MVEKARGNKMTGAQLIKKLSAENDELKAQLAESERLWELEFKIVAKLGAELRRTQIERDKLGMAVK